MEDWRNLPADERRNYLRVLASGPALVQFMEQNRNYSEELALLAQAASQQEKFSRQVKELLIARAFQLGQLSVSQLARMVDVTRPTIYAWGRDYDDELFENPPDVPPAIIADTVFLLGDEHEDVPGKPNVAIYKFRDDRDTQDDHHREPPAAAAPESRG